MKKVDICVNVYGKPYQTLVTLKSLLKYNSKYINKIYLIEEANQPHPTDFDFIKNELSYNNLVHFKPNNHLWVNRTNLNYLQDVDYRHSIRYQYAIENTKSDYLFIIHNDVLFKSEFLSSLIEEADKNRYIGIGQLGQCWNCPLKYDNICNRDICQDLKIDYKTVIESVGKYPGTRIYSAARFIDKQNPMPLPECRLNEWFAFLNMKIVGKEFTPKYPFGTYGMMDLGVEFYREAVLSGFKFKNIDINQYCTHAYFNAPQNGCGHAAMSNDELYFKEEELAKEYYLMNF